MFGAEAITDELVRSAVEGSIADRDQIVEALVEQVRAMVRVRLTPTPAQFHVVDDLTQQSLVALIEGFGRLQHQTVQGLRSFMSTIVSRKVADFLDGRGAMKHGYVGSLESSWRDASVSGPLWKFLPASGMSPRSAAGRSEAIREGLLELGRLKPTYREVITLTIFDQLPIAKVAEVMGLSRPATSMLLIRAVKTLRRNLTGSSKVQEDHV